MNVGCPQCASIFRIDPAKVPAGGVRARCSICGGVIPVPEPTAADRAETAGSFERHRTPLPRPHEFTTPTVAMTVPPAPAAPVVAPEPPPFTESGEVTPPMGVWEPAEQAPAPPPAKPQLPPLAGMYTPPEAMRAAPEAPVVAPPVAPPIAAPVAPPAFNEPPAFTEPPVQEHEPPPPPQAPPAAPPAPAQHTPPTPVTGSHVNPYLTRDPHARARRLARALVSDIVVYYRDKHDAALRSGDLREEFRDEIKKSYDDYVSQVGAELAESTTYFQDALNEVLARGRRIF